MSYLVYELRFDPEVVDEDELVALLSVGGFEGFEQTEGILDAYLPEEGKEEAEAWLQRVKQTHSFTYTVEPLPDKNWNAEWEANFSPIQIGDWLGIRASFHEPMPVVDMEIIIDPKMAFGTGHHATTHMVCELMKPYDWAGKTVCDFGCGTGILAILAKKLGAGHTTAIDIEPASYENTIENAQTNGVEIDKVFCGDLDSFFLDLRRWSPPPPPRGEFLPAEVQKRKYHYILANINRGVILESLAPLKKSLLPGGKLFVSGILEVDATLVLKAADDAGLRTVEERQQGDWMAWVFEPAT
ncbi:MAG: 50S ribosomal protein L11 methyltransferase [Bacteroidota bacterium]